MSTAFRSLASVASRTRGGNKLTVLAYHRVRAAPDPLFPEEPDERMFAGQIKAISSNFSVLPLGEAIERLTGGRLGPRAACITFDDGYADNFEIAFPLLRRFGLTATFFVTTGSIDGGRMWNDSIIEAVRSAAPGRLDLSPVGLGKYTLSDFSSRRRAIGELVAHLRYRPTIERDHVSGRVVEAVGKEVRSDLMMTSDQIHALDRAGMEIGAHTVTHSRMITLSDQEALTEIVESRSRLKQITGRDTRVFAYPNGKPAKDYSKRDVQLLRELAFTGAVSTAWGVGTPQSDPLQVPRFTPWDRAPARFLWRLLCNYARTDAERV